MKSRVIALLLLLLLLLLLALPPAAMAANRYPTLDGTVTDNAGALSAVTLQDIVKYQALLEDADVDIELHVVMVHFLDGESAQSYAQAVFDREKLGSKALLLLGAVGEDRFACVLGSKVQKKLSDSSMQAMLYASGFAEQFQAQQYTAAFGQFFAALSEQVDEKYGEKLNTAGLFGVTAVQAQAQTAQQSTSYAQVLSDFLSDYTQNAKEHNYTPQQNKTSEGLTPAGWIVLVVLILLIFSQSDPARKARRKARRRW